MYYVCSIHVKSNLKGREPSRTKKRPDGGSDSVIRQGISQAQFMALDLVLMRWFIDNSQSG